MDYAKIIEAISKISSFESVIVVGILVIGYIFYHLIKNNFNWKNFLLFTGSIMVLPCVGAYVIVKKMDFSEKDMIDLQKKYDKILNARDSLKLSNQKNEILKDTCFIEKQRISLQIDSLKSRKEFWKEKFQIEVDERRRLSNEIKKYTGHKYKYCEGYALIRDPDSGLHGYHKKGAPVSSIKFGGVKR